MNKKLLKQIILSKKSFLEVINLLGCSVDDFVEKISGVQKFNNEEMSLLTTYIPIDNPIEIFFEHYVAE